MDYYAGLDVSLEATSICVVDSDGKIVVEARAPSDPEAVGKMLAATGLQLKRVGCESAHNNHPISVSARHLNSLVLSPFGGVLIGADRDPAES